MALAAEKDNSYGVCDHGERTSLAAPTRQSTIRLSKVFCEVRFWGVCVLANETETLVSYFFILPSERCGRASPHVQKLWSSQPRGIPKHAYAQQPPPPISLLLPSFFPTLGPRFTTAKLAPFLLLPRTLPLSHQDDGYETADDGSSGGLLQENSAMPVSLAPSSSTSSGAGGAGGGVRRDVGNNRRGVDVVADKDGQAGFLSRTAFAAMSVAAPGNDGNNSDDDCWDTVIDDEAGSLPVAAREEEGGRQARSSSQRTGAILADPPSPVLFRAGNGYDRGAEVLIPPDGPGGLPVVACPPPRLTRLRTTPEGRVVASDAAVVPIPRRKRRGRRRQRRVRELDVPTTAAASVLNRALEFDGDGCSSSNSGGGGGGPGRSGEAAFDRIPQWQAGGRGDGGGSRTPSGAFKSPAPDANATSHRRRIPPTPARQRCAFEDEESDDDDETAQQDGGEGKNVEHKRTRSEPASILPRPHARGELGTAAYYETLRQDGEQGKTHWPAMTVGTGGSSGGGSPSRSIALRYDGDGERPSADGGVVSRRIARGWVTGTGFGGPRSAPSSRRGSGTKRGGGGGWKNSGYTAVLGRLKGMLNLESKPRTPPVRRMSR